MPAGPPPRIGTSGGSLARSMIAACCTGSASSLGCVPIHASPQCARPQVAACIQRESRMVSTQLEHDLKQTIRTIADYPKPGIMFRDITTLLGNARAFRRAVDEMVQPWAGMKIDKVAGIEARGFILGGAVAHQVSAGFIPIRKKGKLPHKRVSIAYSLEYGLD